MSYDLSFWRYKPGVRHDHQAVYTQLSDGGDVEGLEDLPINTIVARIAQVFSDGWERLSDDVWESEGAGFQVFTTKQYFAVTCYGVEGEDMNKFIDVLTDFECRLYDPQVGRRFDEA